MIHFKTTTSAFILTSLLSSTHVIAMKGSGVKEEEGPKVIIRLQPPQQPPQDRVEAPNVVPIIQPQPVQDDTADLEARLNAIRLQREAAEKEAAENAIRTQKEIEEQQAIEKRAQLLKAIAEEEAKLAAAKRQTEEAEAQAAEARAKAEQAEAERLAAQNVQPSQPLDILGGRTPERAAHNVVTELDRGVQGATNFFKGKGWTHKKK